MLFVRAKKDQEIFYGWQKGEEITRLDGDIFGIYENTNQTYKLSEVELLAPCEPSKALCLGLNYRDHAEEFKFPIPEYPIVFMKPNTSLANPNQNIVYPNMMSRRLDYEGELAIVIGKECYDIETAEANDYIFGYTCGNDVTARDLQPKKGQWTVAKSFNTFLPLGPAIETEIDPENLTLKTYHNGKLVQQSNTKNLIFKIPYIVSYLSQVMPLFPGDVILTGTPSGVGPMIEGDEVTIEISRIGKLTNKVVLQKPGRGKYPGKNL